MKILPQSLAATVLLFHAGAWAQQPAAPQPYPGPPPGQPYPGQPYPAPAQPYPAQPYPAPAQPSYPQPPYPAPAAPAQPYPQPPPQAPQPQVPAPAEPAPIPPPVYRPPTYYYYPPPAAHRGIYRPFTMSAGLGVGLLSLPGVPRENDVGYNYLARIGFGLTPDFIVYLGVDGTGVSQPDYDLTDTNYLLGVQYFVVSRLFLRGGVGIAGISDSEDSGASAGQAFLAGLGVELVQGDSVAFALELTSSAGRLRSGTYFSNALSFSLSFY
jgi:hypothetical protein